jgi:hypothetical protein
MANRPIQRRQLTPFRELYAQGVRVFHIDATFSEDIFHPELRAWVAENVFDYSYQENYWNELLAECPDAKLCLRLYSASPPWWDESHSEELQRYADGSVEADFQRSARRTLPSLASQVWRNAASGALTRFLVWLEESGWSGRIWGLFLGYGITWEWGILGTDKFPDYSEPMCRYFRQWLRGTYQSVAGLRVAWGDSEVTFETAEIPVKQERLAGRGGLRVFPRDRAAADFQNCLSDANSDYLIDLGGTVRKVAGTRYKLGTFYGYTLTAREHSDFTALYGAGGLLGGHHAFGRFLRSGIFDFNASPYAYANRELGSGCLIQHFPRASCQWHGLRVYDENDLRTFLVAGMEDDRSISIGQTERLADSIAHQRWALAQALCHGTSYWWTELSDWIGPYQPYFDHPALLEELRGHLDEFHLCQKRSAPSLAEIAIIIDERSLAALSPGSKLFKREIYDQLAAWSWCGAPFDVWLAEDVCEETMRGVKLAYIFAPAPSAPLRTALRQALGVAGRTVWWAPYCGWITDHGFDEAAFRALTGQDLPHDHAELRRKEMDGWISLYGACAGLSAERLGEIAREAGVHCYGEAPLHVMKGENFFAVQSAWSGLHSPPPPDRSIWRAFPMNGESSFSSVSLNAGETHLFARKNNQ